MTNSIEQLPSESLKKLKEYQAQGYVFHGSANPEIKILEPRVAKDDDPKRDFNNDTAVFASAEFVSPIIFS